MKKIKLGTSGIEVGSIGLGSINFGTKIDSETAFSISDTYVSEGGNFIDTANNYAVWNGGDGGESERTLGEWMHARGNRDKVVVATKLGALPGKAGTDGFSNMQGLRPAVILEAVDNSLKNLKTDYIDVLYLHVDDFSIPQFEVMKTLHTLVTQGKVRAVGCSNFYAWRIENARRICEENGFTFFSAVQQRYSYLTPLIDADFFPQVAVNQDMTAYLNHYKDMTLVAYSPLLNGQYTSLDTIMDEKYLTDENRARLAKLKSEKKPVSTVLKYITESFGGSVALITTSKAEHIREILAGM